MLSGLFSLIGKAKAAKSTIESFVERGKALATFIDRFDDDTDGDGKAQYQDILEKLKAWEDEVVAGAKRKFADLKVIWVEIVAWISHLRTGK